MFIECLLGATYTVLGPGDTQGIRHDAHLSRAHAQAGWFLNFSVPKTYPPPEVWIHWVWVGPGVFLSKEHHRRSWCKDHRRNTDIVRGENIETSLITILQKLPKWRSSQRAVGTEEKDGGRAKGGPAQAYEPKDRVVFKPDLERWPSHGHLAVLEREGLRNRK